jgi:hypothetical protein
MFFVITTDTATPTRNAALFLTFKLKTDGNNEQILKVEHVKSCAGVPTQKHIKTDDKTVDSKMQRIKHAQMFTKN